MTRYFSCSLFCVVYMANLGVIVFSFSYACMRAPSNSDVDFLLSQVSQMGKIIPRNCGKCRLEMGVFRGIFDGVEVDYRVYLLKYVYGLRNDLEYSVL